MIDTGFLHELSRFNLVIRKRVTSKFIGPRKSVAQGRGIMFKDHRVYAPGDDFRTIDWKVFARTDDLMVKTFEEERNLVAHIIVDNSASMNYGSKHTKHDFASMLGVGFAYLALKENEKFMFSTFSDKLDVFQPRRGMSHLATMVQHLNSIKPKGRSRLEDSLSQYRKLLGSRALVILISDFLVDIKEIENSLFHLKKHETKVIQVLDPVEMHLGLEGDFRLRDSESGTKLKTYISPRLKERYKKLLDDHTGRIADTCTRLGLKFHRISTDTQLFDAFYEILY